jgi:Holliday junction DNA helicase RuvB
MIKLEDKRPELLKDFFGQTRVKELLEVFIEAAKKRGETLDHLLLHGPPGLGKTSLARIIAREMQTSIKVTSGPIMTKVGDLAALLTNIQEGEILFIDEIHRLPKAVEESLYAAMEDFTLDIIIGEGPTARSLNLSLPPFTLIGATTKLGLISKPLQDRFGITFNLDFYQLEELKNLLLVSSKKISFPLDEIGALEIAKRARGTPRRALKLLRRVRDFLSEKKEKRTWSEILDLLGIDELGLDSLDQKYLNYLYLQGKGRPLGLKTIMAGLLEDANTITDLIEPYLLQIGFIIPSSKGRILTEASIRHIRKNYGTENLNS